MTARVNRPPLAVWPTAGRCTVCGHHAQVVVVYPQHREVRHVPDGWGRCVLPNPPVPPAKAEVAS